MGGEVIVSETPDDFVKVAKEGNGVVVGPAMSVDEFMGVLNNLQEFFNGVGDEGLEIPDVDPVADQHVNHCDVSPESPAEGDAVIDHPEVDKVERSSNHRAEVVPFCMEPHPDADQLSIVRIGGYTYVARMEDWTGVTKAAYIPPDSTVDPKREEFAWLAGTEKADGRVRVRAKKIRGVVSYGLMSKVPDSFEIGDDVTEFLDVQHYQPGEANPRGDKKNSVSRFSPTSQCSGPPGLYIPKYDLENFRRYSYVFEKGETVFVHEKLDGSNIRFCYQDGEQYVGSREQWKMEYSQSPIQSVQDLVERGCNPEKAESIWKGIESSTRARSTFWQGLTEEIKRWCRDHERDVLAGELAGTTNMIKYGPNRVAGFDIWRQGRFVDVEAAYEEMSRYGIDTAPLLYSGPFSEESIYAVTDGPTAWKFATNKVIREGCVVKPTTERLRYKVGRVALKCVSGVFLDKYKGD
jgi:RNA ligase (TIGR02306 family)